MTKLEYLNSGCENRHSRFILRDGSIVYGVATTFFFDEPNNYYLVKTPNMVEFKKYMDKSLHSEMKKICEPINLEDIVNVRRADEINYKTKAKIALLGLSDLERENAKNLIRTISEETSELQNYDIVKIHDKQMHVVRLNANTRILIEEEKDYDGINVIDIIFNK